MWYNTRICYIRSNFSGQIWDLYKCHDFSIKHYFQYMYMFLFLNNLTACIQFAYSCTTTHTKIVPFTTFYLQKARTCLNSRSSKLCKCKYSKFWLVFWHQREKNLYTRWDSICLWRSAHTLKNSSAHTLKKTHVPALWRIVLILKLKY